MKKRCAYCGEMILKSAKECEHCGRIFSQPNATKQSRATGIEKWEKGVPSWVIYATIVIGILLIGLMYYQAVERLSDPTDPPTATAPNGDDSQ